MTPAKIKAFILLLGLVFTPVRSVIPTWDKVTSLANGRYTAKSDVSGWANLALDIAEMKDETDKSVISDIYENGKHSKYRQGGFVRNRALAKLSLEAFGVMGDDAMYNFFRHAFLELGEKTEGEQLGLFDNKPVGEYSHTLVTDLLKLDKMEAAPEAALVMGVWMHIVHQLYEITRACEENLVSDMENALDIAAALWVGVGQEEGDIDSGNMLYNLAQQAGEHFGQGSGETTANFLILEAFNKLQLDIRSGVCGNSQPDAYISFRNKVREVIGYMTIPLVQRLIHHIMYPESSKENADFVELYALSIGARVEACKPTAYSSMLDLFVRNDFKQSSQHHAIELLHSVYSCVQVTCDQIGVYRDDIPECNDDIEVEKKEYAGYPQTFDATLASRIDRDILQIKILTEARAYGAVLDYYTNGYNSDVSLKDMATSSGRDKVGKVFDAFANYFSDPDYGDTLFHRIFMKEENFSSALPEQIKALSTGLLTNMIMFMTILEKMYSALELCNKQDATAIDAGALEFDKAVAYYVGSIEGSLKGGLEGGELLYAVAKELCGPFNVCDSDENAVSNLEIIDVFNLAAGDLGEGDCSSLEEKITKQISPLLLVPLVQGTLNAVNASSLLSAGTDDASFGHAFIFSRAILPLFMDNGHSVSNDIIDDDLSFTALIESSSVNVYAIFDSLKASMDEMEIIPLKQKCSQIGKYQLDIDTMGDFCGAPSSTVNPGGLMARTPKPTTTPLAPPAVAPVVIPTEVPLIDETVRPPSSATTLGFGRYIFKNNVDGVAALSKDVAEMKQALSIDDASRVYIEGKNSFVGDNDRVVSLAALSQTAANDMDEDPMFNFFRWGLLEAEVLLKLGTDDFDPLDSAYAHDVVIKALKVAKDQALAAEASVVMSVWMEIAHELYNALDYCRKGEDSALVSLDRGMALWLGVGQVEGSSDIGNFMYSISEKAEENFGGVENESRVNEQLIDGFVDAAEMVDSCNGDTERNSLMTDLISRILRIMTIPLLQHLIYHIWEENKEYVQLYAVAVVPQASGCSESIFNVMSDELLREQEVFSSNNLDALFFDAVKKFQQCLRISCEDIIGNSSPNDVMRSHINKLCYEEDGEIKNLAGYTPKNHVYEISRLDLDILQMGILMESNAFTAAKRLYQTGYNSLAEGSSPLNSLQMLVKSSGGAGVPQCDALKNYLLKDDYADDFILNILDGRGVFEKANKDQRAEAAMRAAQGMISFMAIIGKLCVAVSQCQKGLGEESVKSWDEAVALFVGSIEGSSRGGTTAGDGTFIYALAKESAYVFGTVEGSKDASSNEKLILSMQDGQSFLASKICTQALSTITDEVLELLPIPMIQGILYYAVENEALDAGSSSHELATAYVLSESIKPLISAVNTTSAETVTSQLFFDPETKPVLNGADAVFEAIAFSLPGLKIKCNDVGAYKSRGVCSNNGNDNGDEGDDGTGEYEVISPHPETPSSLSNGLYTTTTYVQDRANIAIDLKDITDALNSGSYDLARILYQKGENSNIYNDKGIRIGERSIASFSVQDSNKMVNEPLFNIYQYALRDNEGKILNNDSRLYADSIVNNYLNSIIDNDKSIAADAMLVLNIWMKLVHELFQTLDNCRKKKIADSDGVHSIDEAVAYWIGDGQVTGDGGKGHLFYALAEKMGDKFERNTNGQSKTNVNILRLFNQAKIELSYPNACSENLKTYTRLRQIVMKILSQMTIPLIQSLIHYLKESNKYRVQLYSYAVVPLTAGCDPELHKFLHSKLIENTYNVVESEDIITRLQTVYPCLGLTCDDIGQHISDSNIGCNDGDKDTPLAGFMPTTNVREYAQLDLDVLEIKILMEMEAYQAADDLYSHGKHAEVDGFNGPEMVSLASLATSSDRSIVPQLDSFVRYYGNRNYADDIIRDALNFNKLTNASKEQRQEIVVKSIQYLVLYMGALQAAYDALNLCRDGSSNISAEEAWDRSAALLIGSIKGSSYGSDMNRQSFFALAQVTCREFNNCDDDGVSQVNKKLVLLLYAGKGEIKGGSCNALSRTVKKIGTTLLVPLIQSTLRCALANDKTKEPSSSDFAVGYIFSRAVLPLVEDVDRNQAQIINRNMDFQFRVEPVVNGAAAVFNAFAVIYNGLNINCKDIGNASGDGVIIDPCTGVGATTIKSSSGNRVLFILAPILAVIGIVSLFFVRRSLRKRRSKIEEEAPMFHPSNGVLDSDQDLLHGGYSDAAIVDGDEAFS
eukprot:CAMPEP_0194239472 /NCGR_PEP_ID=MMETSP0158-20130606/5916_1 /TAXON_ID=33649 /ORGANISM="Thalassionema nitzschioides, Strain L26-B" /LENGTH=2221 /DNA_ID=CAMNT_0038973949 /DNA_START=97 /DNA_END=6759 /DNA_ORIENTATION=+